jgi:hypothetical protein
MQGMESAVSGGRFTMSTSQLRKSAQRETTSLRVASSSFLSSWTMVLELPRPSEL